MIFKEWAARLLSPCRLDYDSCVPTTGRRYPGFRGLESWLTVDRAQDAIAQRSDTRGSQTCLRRFSSFSFSGPFVAQIVTTDSGVSANAGYAGGIAVHSLASRYGLIRVDSDRVIVLDRLYAEARNCSISRGCVDLENPD